MTVSPEEQTQGQGPSAVESPDRRTQLRAAFECVQLIAPYDGQQLPTQADFRHVRCCDLSTSGISFYVGRRFSAERMIVALGSIPFSFVVAETVRVEPTDDGELLIGCQFIERLKF